MYANATRIVTAVCIVMDMPRDRWMDPTNRAFGCIRARQLCVALLRECARMSYKEIAVVMGRDNHSSAVTQYRNFLKWNDLERDHLMQRAEAALQQL